MVSPIEEFKSEIDRIISNHGKSISYTNHQETRSVTIPNIIGYEINEAVKELFKENFNIDFCDFVSNGCNLTYTLIGKNLDKITKINYGVGDTHLSIDVDIMKICLIIKNENENNWIDDWNVIKNEAYKYNLYFENNHIHRIGYVFCYKGYYKIDWIINEMENDYSYNHYKYFILNKKLELKLITN